MGLFDSLKNSKKVSPENRRSKNNEYIKSLNIDYYEALPVIESSSEVKLKDLDSICRRAIACLLAIQLACDIEAQNDYNQSQVMFFNLLKEFGVENDLLPNEKRLFDNNYNQKDVISVSWAYECYWSLVWALGLIEDNDMKVPNDICDCQKAVTLVEQCRDLEEFKSKTKIRDIEEILDMLDLYYRYHWVCVEKNVNPETNIGPLNPEVVWERRKGLEWLISNVDDWEEISLDT